MSEKQLKRIGVNIFLQKFGNLVNKISGWRIEGGLPDVPKSVIIVAPHTSNWDFWVGLMVSFSVRLKAYWLGKHTLFRWPLGGILKRLGGIPVNRTSAQNLVEQVAQIFKQHENFMLAITPEGTRKRVDKWRSGFYHIANAAKVPIICAYLDYKRKVGGFGPVIFPSGDIEADMKIIREFYQTITGKYPENFGNIQFSSPQN